MKSLKKGFALLMLNVMSLPYLLMAQDEGTYIDDMNVQDSSYMEADPLAGVEEASNSNTTVIIIVAVVVVAIVAFVLLRKKKK